MWIFFQISDIETVFNDIFPGWLWVQDGAPVALEGGDVARTQVDL